MCEVGRGEGRVEGVGTVGDQNAQHQHKTMHCLFTQWVMVMVCVLNYGQGAPGLCNNSQPR